MNKLIGTALAAAIALAAASTPAIAREGCGPGGHRGPYGHCRPNRGTLVVAPGGLIVGNFYQGRGYWDGHRYWKHRQRWHNGWRYR